MSEYDEEDEGPSLDLKVLVLYGMLRSRGWLVLLAGLGGAGGVLVAASQPNVYTSSAKLQFVPGVAETSSVEDVLGFEDGIRTVPGIEDEVLLLRDPEIYERIAIELTPSWVLRAPEPKAGDTDATPYLVRLMHGLQDWMVQQRQAVRSEPIVDSSPKAIQAATEALMNRIRLSVGRRSQIIVAQADAWNAEDAQRVLTVAVREFIARHNEHYQSNLASLKSELRLAEERLEEAYATDKEHKDSCGFFDLDGDLERASALLIELGSRRRELTAEQKANSTQLEELEGELQSTPDLVTVVEPDRMIVNPRLQILQDQIKRDQEYIETITVREPIRDPVERQRKVEATRAKIEEAETELEDEPPLVSQFPGGPPTRTEPNPERADLEQRIDELRAAISKADIELDLIEKEAAGVQRRQQVATSCKSIHNIHAQGIENRLKRVTGLQARVDIAQGIQDSRDEGESNLRVYIDPDFDPEKSGPKRSKAVLAALAAGIAAGGVLAVLRQLLERRVRYRETLEGGLGMDVLAVVGEHKPLRKLRTGGAR